MWYGGDVGAVLGKLVKAGLKLVKSSNTKEIHLCPWELLKRVQNIAKGKAERHVPVCVYVYVCEGGEEGETLSDKAQTIKH